MSVGHTDYWDVYAIVDDDDKDKIYMEGRDLELLKENLRPGSHLEIISYLQRDNDNRVVIEDRRRIRN